MDKTIFLNLPSRPKAYFLLKGIFTPCPLLYQGTVVRVGARKDKPADKASGGILWKFNIQPRLLPGNERGCKSTVVTGVRGYVLLGGAVGINMDTGAIPEGIREQTKLAMENIKEALEEYCLDRFLGYLIEL